MQRLFVLIFFSMLMLVAYSQELAIKSFSADPTDLTASMQRRNDANGDACALVKVMLARSGATFNGNVVGQPEYSQSEYKVYLTQGTKRLEIKLDGYLPLFINFSDYGIKALSSMTTYRLIMSLPESTSNVGTKVKTGWIIIDSQPQGASVYINDKYVGNTPLDTYKAPYGHYSYRLEKGNYYNENGQLDLNQSNFEIVIPLRPAFGDIQVLCSVPDAQVLLDGKTTGKSTPCVLNEVSSGSHRVTVQKPKYTPQQFDVVVKDGETIKLNASLDARFANLSIKSIDGAQILIDGKNKGVSVYHEELMEGYYDVEVRMAHYKPSSKQIEIKAGQDQNITLEPSPIYGTLDIMSSPRKAKVLIDGKDYGVTPMTVDQILEGEHVVSLTLDGYNKEEKNITIQENTLSEVNIQLSQKTGQISHNTDNRVQTRSTYSFPSGVLIRFSTNVSNADLYIDNHYMGTISGNSIRVPLGEHKLTVNADGYYSFTNPLFVDRNTNYIHLPLEPIEKEVQKFDSSRSSSTQNNIFKQYDLYSSLVSFTSNKPDASLYIDGQYAGPLKGDYYLKYGMHAIEVKINGILFYKNPLDVSAGTKTVHIPINQF